MVSSEDSELPFILVVCRADSTMVLGLLPEPGDIKDIMILSLYKDELRAQRGRGGRG